MQRELAANGGEAQSVERLPSQMPLKGGILQRKSDGPTFRKPDRPKRSLLGLDRTRQSNTTSTLMSFDMSKDENQQFEVDEDQPSAKKAKTGSKKKKKHQYRKRMDDTPSHPGGVDHAKAAEIGERKTANKRRSATLESSTKKDRSDNERRRATRRAEQDERRRKEQRHSGRRRGDRDRDRERDRERRTRDRDRDRDKSERRRKSSRDSEARRKHRQEEKERAYVTLFQNRLGGDFEDAVALNTVGNTPLTSPFHAGMKTGSATPLRASDADSVVSEATGSVVSDAESASTWEPDTPLRTLQSENRKGW